MTHFRDHDQFRPWDCFRQSNAVLYREAGIVLAVDDEGSCLVLPRTGAKTSSKAAGPPPVSPVLDLNVARKYHYGLDLRAVKVPSTTRDCHSRTLGWMRLQTPAPPSTPQGCVDRGCRCISRFAYTASWGFRVAERVFRETGPTGHFQVSDTCRDE
jgi:hypothetical protein